MDSFTVPPFALQFAVVRLDGDTFFSTYEAIEILYPHLSPDGGFFEVR